MRAIISNQIIVEDYTKELLNWCNKNLRYRNPEYAKQFIVKGYRKRVPEYIYMFYINQNKLVLPFGCLKQIWEYIKDCYYVVNFKAKPIYPISSIRLYDYQEKALSELLQAKNGILISKAGSGKTQIMLELICRLGYKALWVNNKRDLMNQAYERAKANISNVTFGKITEGKVDIGDVTFATVQTLAKLDLNELKDEWAVIILDECQNIYKGVNLTQYSKVLNSLAARFKFGCTATLHRADGLEGTCCDLIGDVVYEVPEEEVADKIIRADIQPVSTNYRASMKIRRADGTIKSFANFITDLCENEERNKLILQYLQKNKDKHCLVLSDRVTHLRYLQKKLGKGVVIDGTMTSKTKKEERKQALEDMRNGKEKILFATYSLAKEGLDIPILDRLFLVAPKKDLTVVIQSVGRVERTCEGKEQPIVYDFVDDKELMLEKMYIARKRIYKKNNNNILT